MQQYISTYAWGPVPPDLGRGGAHCPRPPDFGPKYSVSNGNKYVDRNSSGSTEGPGSGGCEKRGFVGGPKIQYAWCCHWLANRIMPGRNLNPVTMNNTV